MKLFLTTDISPRTIPALMLCSMTSQALLVVLTGSVAAVAVDLGIETVAATQARTVTAAAALAAALVLLVKVTALGARRIAIAGIAFTVAGTIAVATAGNLFHFLVSHVLVGMAVAALVISGYAGLAGLPKSVRRGGAGWVTAAAGSAWMVGTPVIGLLSEHLTWRLAVFFPVASALGALVLSRSVPGPSGAVIGQGALSSLLGRAGARRWTLAETLANISWASVLTFVGALFVISLGLGDGMTGWLLSIGATCFVAASLSGRRIGANMDLRKLVAMLSVLLAVAVLFLFGAAPLMEPGAKATTVGAIAFAVTGALAGLRIPARATLGMMQHPARPDTMMASRTLCQQVGYLVGSALSGVTVAVAGWVALGPVLAVVLLGSAVIVLRLAPDYSRQR